MGPNSLKSESIIKIKFTTPGANVENIFLVVIPYTKANLENISLNIYILISALLRNCFLCWDRWNST